MLVLLKVLVWVFVLPWIGIRSESLRDFIDDQKDVHFPYVVSIQIITGSEGSMTVDFYAAGALVSDKLVLSTCHKFLKEDKYWQTRGALLVVAGASKLAGNHTIESDRAQIRHVGPVIRHPKCFSKIPHIFGFDAAVLTLKKPMKLNRHVQPIALKFNDLTTLERELAKMENKKVICSTFRWGWRVIETPILIVTDATTKMNPRMKRTANDSFSADDVTSTTTSPRATLSSRHAASDLTTLTTTNDFPTADGSKATIQSYSEINVNKVLITSNDECKKAFCKAGQPSCEHDFAANGQFCTTPWEVANNTCLDDGGPLVCDGYLFGILDFELCLLQRSPAVYAGPSTILELIGTKPTTPPPEIIKASATTASTSHLKFICLVVLGNFKSHWH